MASKVKAVPAPKVLENNFLEARSKLLDIAAILDRIGRGEAAECVQKDLKICRIMEALKILEGKATNKAELIQQLFSLPYDANWTIPTPRY